MSFKIKTVEELVKENDIKFNDWIRSLAHNTLSR